MRSRFLEKKELAKLKKHMGVDWLPFALALETGLRIGDVAKIRWDDLKGRRLDFVAQKTGKRGSAQLSADLLRRLEAVRVGAWLFPAPRDSSKHITRQLLWKRLKNAAAAVGIPLDGTSPHSLRKVFAVREYKAHGMAAAQAGLQHTDMSTTEIYTMADWLTGENAEKPLLRSDLARILRYIEEFLFSSLGFTKREQMNFLKTKPVPP